MGGVSNQPATGAATPASPLPSALITPAVTIGGAAADVLFAGLAPYLVGVAQFNIRLPATLPAGSRLPLVIRFGNAASQPVNLAVQPSPTPPVNVLISDSFNRANTDKCALGKADLALGGTGSHYYVPVFPTGAVIVSGALQNNSQAYGGVQLTNSSTPCSAWGETVGQDLNIKLDLLLPTDAAGHISQGGPYLRARSAFTADGILGGDSAGYWIQLQSTGEVKIKNLNSASVIATSARPASFDSKVFHTLEVSVKENSLQASVDGVLATFGQSTTVSIPPTAGSNNGAAGIAFAAEPNQGAIGGQRARNLAVTAYRALP